MKNKLMLLFVLACIFCITACSYDDYDDVVVLRVCNWEEYIDEGGWDDDELIELDNGERIIGEDPVYKEFEDWYYSLYGKKVRVEYSTFGTNEELYNQLTIGDRFDIVCPSEYMIMKLMAENQLVPYSDDFYDERQKLGQLCCRIHVGNYRGCIQSGGGQQGRGISLEYTC